MERHSFPCHWRLCYYIWCQVALCAYIPRVACHLQPSQLNRSACEAMEWIGGTFSDFSLLDRMRSCCHHLFIRGSYICAKYWDALSIVRMILVPCFNRNFLLPHLWNWRCIKGNPKLVSTCQLQIWKTISGRMYPELNMEKQTWSNLCCCLNILEPITWIKLKW